MEGRASRKCLYLHGLRVRLLHHLVLVLPRVVALWTRKPDSQVASPIGRIHMVATRYTLSLPVFFACRPTDRMDRPSLPLFSYSEKPIVMVLVARLGYHGTSAWYGWRPEHK
uniref:Putative secreted protein n=1 Tax=Anopheles darlingi TaxID=43151 RepID=A0A2M4DJ78_ANODA